MKTEEIKKAVKQFNLPVTLDYCGYSSYFGCWAYWPVPIEKALKAVETRHKSDGTPFQIPILKKKVKLSGGNWVVHR